MSHNKGKDFNSAITELREIAESSTLEPKTLSIIKNTIKDLECALAVKKLRLCEDLIYELARLFTST